MGKPCVEGKLQAPQNMSWFYKGFIFQSGMQVFFDIGLEKLPKFAEGCCEWVSGAKYDANQVPKHSQGFFQFPV